MAEVKTPDERFEICQACPHYRQHMRQCKICWCFIDAKVRLPNQKCPIDKW